MINLCFNNYFSRDIDFLWQKPFSLLPSPCLPFPEQGSSPPGRLRGQDRGWSWGTRAATARKGAAGRPKFTREPPRCSSAARRPGPPRAGSLSAPQGPPDPPRVQRGRRWRGGGFPRLGGGPPAGCRQPPRLPLLLTAGEMGCSSTALPGLHLPLSPEQTSRKGAQSVLAACRPGVSLCPPPLARVNGCPILSCPPWPMLALARWDSPRTPPGAWPGKGSRQGSNMAKGRSRCSGAVIPRITRALDWVPICKCTPCQGPSCPLHATHSKPTLANTRHTSLFSQTP